MATDSATAESRWPLTSKHRSFEAWSFEALVLRSIGPSKHWSFEALVEVLKALGTEEETRQVRRSRRHLDSIMNTSRPFSGWLYKAVEVLAIVIWVTLFNASAPILGVPYRTLTTRSNSNVDCRRSPKSKLRLHALIGAVLVVAALVGCSATRPLATNDELNIPKPPLLNDDSIRQPQTDLVAIVQSIPESASRQQMDESLNRFMPEFYKVRSGDMQQVIAAVTILKDQPAIVVSLIDYYDSFRAPEYEKRMMTLGLIGELQRTDAMPFFLRIIWDWLRMRQPIAEGPTPTELLEMIRVKAVHGLAYLRTVEAAEALIDIMRSHESVGIRIAAIDSYMWNNRDSEEAAEQLYIALPTYLHRFVERPRFHRGVDRAEFNAQLRVWQNRWAQPRSPQ